jgi:Domain of unknown function (DUF4397)
MRSISYRRLAWTLALLAGCNSTTGLPIPSGSARLQLFNAAKTVGSVDLDVGGQVIHGVGYGAVTPSLQLDAGDQTVRVMAGSSALATRTLTLEDGSNTMLVLSQQGAGVDLAVAVDTGLAKTDQANLRLISAPDLPRTVADSSVSAQSLVDVYVTPSGTSIATLSPQVVMETQVPSYSSYLYFTPGSLDVTYTRRGTKTVVAQVTGIVFAPGDAKAVVIERAADGSFRTRVDPID